MTTNHLLLKTAVCSAAVLALLAGCDRKDDASPGAPAAAGGPLKIAFAYVGPVGDGGWTYAHDKARKAVEQAFGDKVATTIVEKVPEAADAERVFRDMVAQGNQL